MRTGFWKSGIKRGPVSHHGSLSSAVPPYISLSFRMLKRGQALVCTNEQHLNLITHKTQLSVEHFQDKVAGNTKNCFPSRECFLKGTQSVTAVRVLSIRMEQNYTLHSFPVNLWSCLFSKTEVIKTHLQLMPVLSLQSLSFMSWTMLVCEAQVSITGASPFFGSFCVCLCW